MARTRKTHAAPNPQQAVDSHARLLTRAEIAARYGVTYAVVCGWHARELITPAARRADGRYVYAETAVTALGYDRRIRVAGPGELAALAISLYRSGADVGDVIERLRVRPQLALRWAELAGALVLSRAQRAALTGKLASVARTDRARPVTAPELLEAVSELVDIELRALRNSLSA